MENVTLSFIKLGESTMMVSVGGTLYVNIVVNPSNGCKNCDLLKSYPTKNECSYRKMDKYNNNLCRVLRDKFHVHDIHNLILRKVSLFLTSKIRNNNFLNYENKIVKFN